MKTIEEKERNIYPIEYQLADLQTLVQESVFSSSDYVLRLLEEDEKK